MRMNVDILIQLLMLIVMIIELATTDRENFHTTGERGTTMRGSSLSLFSGCYCRF